MNEFQLQCIPTLDLELLRSQITAELNRRTRPVMLQRKLARIGGKSLDSPEARKLLNKEIFEYNSKHLFSPPKLHRRKAGSMLQFLPAILAQDWSHLFGERIGDRKFYVYAHIDPRAKGVPLPNDLGGPLGGAPFYIGKGTGDRAHNLKRNQGHGKMIDSVLRDGVDPARVVKILRDGLTEAEAFELESKLIYFFGTIYQMDRRFGCLYNLELPATPTFVGSMQSKFEKPAMRHAHDENGELTMVPVKGRRVLPSW